MRILLLNQTFFPDRVATAQHTTDLARFLIKNGCDVTVVTARRAYDRPAEIFPAFENHEGIHVHRVSNTGFGKGSFLRRLVDAITFDLSLAWKLMRLPRFDYVVSFTSPPLVGLFGTLFCLLKGGKSVQWLMDINPASAIAVGYLNARSPITQLLVSLFRWTLRQSQLVIVLDRWMKKKVTAYGVNEAKIIVVPPWSVTSLPLQNIRESRATNPYRQELGLQGKFIVMYSGNLSIVHPIATLLQAALVMKDDSSLVFLFVGGGLRWNEVGEYARQHRLSNIRTLPYQPRERLTDSLGLADLHTVIMGEKVNGLVHASKIYGILAMGRPYVAVAPEASHLGDEVRACPGGYLVEHGHVRDLIQVIEKARALSEEQYEQIRGASQRYVSENYGMETCLKPLLHALFPQPALPELKQRSARSA